MAQQTINIGASPNDGTGTPLRTAFQYTNSNFSELYTATGPSGNNIVVPGNATITGALTVDTTTLVVNPAGYADRVGIGTASPSYDLEIAGAVRSSLAIRGNFAGGTDIAHLRFINANGSIVGDIYAQNTNGGASDSAYLSFNTASSGTSSERYRIAADGVATWSNVGGVAGTAMTLNATGLGVGVAPSGDKLLVSQTIGLVTSTTADVNFRNIGLTAIQRIRYDDSTGTLTIGSALGTAYPVQIGGNTTSRAVTIDASGNLLVGKTASGAYTNGTQLFPAGTVATGHPNGTGSGAAYSIFAYDGVRTGDITQNGTTGVLYNTASDYRLKEQVQPLSGGLARVNALKPSVYKWKSDGSNGEGFLAHELAEVVPFAVSGEKDAVNEDGSIKSQGIDMSRVVPILVAAIQELTARVQTLETR